MSEAAVKKKSETNVKDTIESILVAFILAFIFRCFVVEAFVIPTGSMAPTLLGAHMDFRCPDCGYRFTAGYHANSGNETFSIPATAAGTFCIYCPNCGFRLPSNLEGDTENDATNPTLKYGDRILVMKYTYLLHEPARWDVVVFKSPNTSNRDYSVNFIKRLVGNPGESLFVAHGDLYVAPPGADPGKYESYAVQTKPRWAQDALWRIVFDADYVPRGLQETGELAPASRQWQQPWQQHSGQGWINNDVSRGISSREFIFDNPGGKGVLQFIPDKNLTAATLNDWLAYDQTGSRFPTSPDNSGLYPPPSILRDVGDLKVHFFVSGLEGTIQVVLAKEADDRGGMNEFVAELSQTQVRLLMRSVQGEQVIGTQAINLRGTHEVSFENVDYRACLRIDNKDLLATTPDNYRPNVQQVVTNFRNSPRGSVRIEGDHAKARIQHLRLWRDVYYRETDPYGTVAPRAVALGNLDRVAKLQNDEYFVLGDNSLMSLDARYWDTPVDLPGENLHAQAGVVPGRFMLGKAFFVYWPAGYRPAGKGPIALVPNFGDMRFIR